MLKFILLMILPVVALAEPQLVDVPEGHYPIFIPDTVERGTYGCVQGIAALYEAPETCDDPQYDFYDGNDDGVIDYGGLQGCTYDPCDPEGRLTCE